MRVAAAVACAVALAVSGVAARQADPGVAKVREAYQKAISAQDAAGLAKLYTADGVEMPPNAPAQKGRAAIEAFHKGLAKEWMVHGMTITSTETTVAGDHAIDIGTYKQNLMPMKGGPMVDEVGKYIVVLKKEGAGWAISRAIYNSDNPPPGAATPKK
ncbi:MAG TPA: nuclear transport factor 2 family protein [Vicinamibacterales bacterium]|nr:nuclear transport factor 2 family protein [Vicinamibacterales bacterium]